MDIPVFIWLILLPLIGSPIVYLSGHLGNQQGWRSISFQIGMLVMMATWVPFVQSASIINQSGPQIFTIGEVTLGLDGISLLLAAVALGLGTLALWFSGPYLGQETGLEKFYAMLLAMVGVMIGLGCAFDLFNLWIWFEAMAVSSYLLVTFYRDQPPSLEAGLKYLVQSAAGSVLVLLAIAAVLSQTGTVNLFEIKAMQVDSDILLAAGALFIIGFGVKAALIPLHTWLPDAHSQAPSGISAMLSGVVIEAGLIAMLRSLSAIDNITALWGPLLMGFGCLNMLVGNLMALQQKQVKRLLAYSSLTHMGYMLVGIGIAIYASQLNGATGGMFHLFNHGMMKGLAFLAAGALLYTLHLTAGSHGPLTVSDLSGASRRYPLVALTFSLSILALGGIPPLAGFMSKWQIITSGFETQNWLIIAVAIFAAINSVFSLAYYAPMVNSLYRREQSAVVTQGKSIPGLMYLPLVALAVMIVVVGIWPSLVYWLTYPAGAALLAAFGG